MTRKINDWGSNILAFTLVIIINALANIIPLGGQGTGAVSAKYPSLFTPAGYTFSIWGLIYFALTAYVIYQALPAQRNNQLLAKITPWFLLSCVANSGWIFAWHYDALVISLLLMLVILVSLLRIYFLLTPASGGQRWFINLPFSIYTGWITVATIANASALQTAMGWNDVIMSATSWTQFKLALAGAIAATIVSRRGDLAFILVISWAALGIVVKQAATPAVAGAASTLVILSLMLVVYEGIRKLRKM